MKFEIVPPAKAKLLRESFIQKFLDTSSDYYRKHIASMSQYADDLFYDGYLWDCLQCNEKYQKECSMEVAAPLRKQCCSYAGDSLLFFVFAAWCFSFPWLFGARMECKCKFFEMADDFSA